MFDHHDDHRIFIQPLPVNLETVAIALSARKADTALSAWRVIHAIDCGFGISGGFNHRHHHAGCPGIHNGFDLIGVI